LELFYGSKTKEALTRMEPNIIELIGPPVPAARPRVTKRGFAFDPKSSQKKAARKFVSDQWHREPLREPLSLDLSFAMPIPKSISKKRHLELIGAPHVVKPDCDNLAKFALDALNGIVYYDDSCVFNLKITKTYSDNPKTLIKIFRK
jgi:Holliday junction resolvase RusA-like endonuclease